MKKNIIIIYFFIASFFEFSFSFNQQVDIKTEKEYSEDKEEENDLDDEKLFEEIIEIISSSYKNMIDVAALYFSGFSINKDKLYDQIIIQLSKDMFHLIKLFAWYVPVMLKNPKLKKKEKLKKSFYIIGVTTIFSYLISELLNKNNQNSLLNNNDLYIKRGLSLDSSHDFDNDNKLFKPRTRPKIDS